MNTRDALTVFMLVMRVRQVRVFVCKFLVSVYMTMFSAEPGCMRVDVVPICMGVPVLMGHLMMVM